AYLSHLSHLFTSSRHLRVLPSFPTRRSSDLWFAGDGKRRRESSRGACRHQALRIVDGSERCGFCPGRGRDPGHHRPERRRQEHRSEEHTSELQSRGHLVCRLLLEKKKHIKRL